MRDLTPKEQQGLIENEKEWVKKITSLKLDKSKVEKAVAWMYGKLNRKVPEIIYCKSPADIILADQNLRRKLENKPPIDAIDKSAPMPEFLGYGNVSDYGWVSYYDYYDQLGEEVSQEFKEYRDIYVAAGIYDAVAYEDYFLCCGKPTEIHYNENGRIHRLDGPCIYWGDSDQFGLYAINGRLIEPAFYKKCLNDKLTKEEFLGLTNDEHRAAAYMIMGDKKVMALVGAEMVDEIKITHHVGIPDSIGGDGKFQYRDEVETIALYKTKGKDNKIRKEPYAWLKRTCPSTGTEYYTPSDPKHNDALSAAKAHRPSWVPEELDYNWFSRS